MLKKLYLAYSAKRKEDRTATQTPVADGQWNVGMKGEILKNRKGKKILQASSK